jgi:hypothetical protein
MDGKDIFLNCHWYLVGYNSYIGPLMAYARQGHSFCQESQVAVRLIFTRCLPKEFLYVRPNNKPYFPLWWQTG